MTESEVVENLVPSLIQEPGSFSSMSANPSQDVNLIGKFGVGFYSAFMVAKQVTVKTDPGSPKRLAWSGVRTAREYTIQPVEGLQREHRSYLNCVMMQRSLPMNRTSDALCRNIRTLFHFPF